MSNYPTVRPSLTLDFQKSKQLDPRISFSRSSTATYVEGGVVKYADEHQARFEKEGLLFEESRTNYCKNYSNFYSNYSNCSIASGLSPAGDNTAQVVTVTANGTAQLRTTGGFKPISVPTNSVGITCSLYVKGSYSYFKLKIFTGSTKQQVIFQNFNTDSWTVSSNSSASFPASNFQVEDAGNGWYRLSFYASNYTTAITIGLWADSGTLSASDTYSVWLPQVEVGTFPTSAIPTEVASEVTRSADVAQITGDNFSSWYNQSEGTMVVSMSKDQPPGTGVFGANLYSGNNRSMVKPRTDGKINFQLTGTGTVINVRPSNSSNFFGQPIKYAFAYKPFDYGLTVRGVSTSVLSEGPQIFRDTMLIGQEKLFGTANRPNCSISRISFYSKRLTDAQLEVLTS